MIKILDTNLNRLGVIKNVIECERLEEINGENTLDFNAVLDTKLNSLIDEDAIFELDNDYFDTAFLKKTANEDNTHTIESEAVHVSYRLNDPLYNVDLFTEIGTPSYILGKILDATGFTVDTVAFTDEVTYSAQEAKSRRQLLMEFVAYLGGEVLFNKFAVSILTRRGSSEVKSVIKDRNVKVVAKSINKRQLDDEGNPLVSYICTPIALPGDIYYLGDSVRLIQKDLDIYQELRVVSIIRDPYDEMRVTFQFANYTNGLESQLYRMATTSVVKDKLYNGIRIGPEYGFEAIRNDKLARAYFRSDGMAFQKGDGTGENWDSRLWFDSSGNLSIKGSITVLGGDAETLTGAQTKADDAAATKSKVFTATPTTPYAVGDLWAQGEAGDLMVCIVARGTGEYNVADWELALAPGESGDLQAFIDDVYNPDMENMEGLIDGKIITWFYSHIPTLSNLPASEWGDDATKDKHLGDLFYDTTPGYAYRFQKVTTVYSWAKIVDQDIVDALADASTAQDTADNKRRVFVAQPTVPYDVGDLWSGGAAGELRVCATAQGGGGSYNIAHWPLATKYTDDVAAKAHADNILKSMADGTYTGGTFIDGKSIISPIIAGTLGRFTTNIKVGGIGNNLAGISGEGTDGDSIRFWAGHETPGSAPFQVTQAGILKAVGALIDGAVMVESSAEDTFYFVDSVDPTKRMQFNLSSISPSTLRVLTVPNNSGTIALTSQLLQLGETSATAYRGDHGKIAYDHSLVVTGAVHGAVSAATVNMIVRRDSAGRARVAAPAHVDDIARLAEINTKENTITAGTTAQYWRGDKTWQTLLGTTSATAYRGDHGLLAYNHITADGSSHAHINQAVTTTSSPTFNATCNPMTEYNWAAERHTVAPSMSLKLFDVYTDRAGSPTTNYGTLFEIYGRHTHTETQLFFDGPSRRAFIRGAWYQSDFSAWREFLTLDLSGYMTRHFTPTPTNTYDLGTSALRWKDLYLSGSAYIADNLSVGGYASSLTFVSGFAGSGWRVDTNNRLTVDYLTVRKIMDVYELVINQIRATNGSIWVSDACKVATVSGTNPYTCTIDVGTGTNNYVPFVDGDVVRCQKWNKQNSSVKYYTATVSSRTNTGFVLTRTNGAGVVEVGDEVVRIGSSVSGRQGAIYLTSSDNNAPYIDVLDGVTSHDFTGKTKVRLGKLDGITDAVMGALSGYGLYSENAYLRGKIVADTGYIGGATNGWEIAAGLITAIGSGKLRTSSTTTRMEMDSTGLKGYNAGTQRVQILSDGSGWLGASDKIAWTNAGVLSVGGWTIDSTSLSGTNARLRSSGILSLGSADAWATANSIYIDGANSRMSIGSGFQYTGGSLTINGSATIGGWTITTSSLQTGAFNTSGTRYFGSSGLSLSNTFSVTSAGALTSISGSIGGWTIDSAGIKAGATNATAKGMLSGNTIAFYAGHLTPGSAPFRVTQAGALFATGATITGSITVTGGSVNADYIDAGTLAVARLAAASITVDKLDVRARTHIANFTVENSLTGWWLASSNGDSTISMIDDGTTQKNARILWFRSNGDHRYQTTSFKVDPTQTYKVTISVYCTATAGNRFFGIYCYDRAGTSIGVIPLLISTRVWETASSNFYFWNQAGSLGSSWRDMEGYILGCNVTDATNVPTGLNVIRHARMPSTAATVVIRVLNWSNAGTTTDSYWYSPSVVSVDGGRLHASTVLAGTVAGARLVLGQTSGEPYLNMYDSSNKLRIELLKDRIHFRDADAADAGYLYAAKVDTTGNGIDDTPSMGLHATNLIELTGSNIWISATTDIDIWVNGGKIIFDPASAGSYHFIVDRSGTYGGNTRPTLRPNADTFGFIGTSTMRFWEMYASGGFKTSSELRMKQNIEDADVHSCYDMVKSLKFYRYKFKTDVAARGDKATEYLGIIADEAPLIVSEEERKNINLYPYISLIGAAVQDIQARLEALERNLNP